MEQAPELRAVVALIASGHFAQGDPLRYAPVVPSLVEYDAYMIVTDYRVYMDAQQRAAAAFCEADAWTRRAILTVARMGFFSSDRAVREYATKIWNVRPETLS